MATLASILTDYESNADYEEVSSQSKCTAFITACRRLIPKLPNRASRGGASEVQLSVSMLREEIRDAKQWLAAHPTSTDLETCPRVLHPDFTGDRGI